MSKDQLPDLLRQMVCRDNDELDIFWKAADEIERLSARLAEVEEKIENAMQAMSETQPSWEYRSHAIMAALGCNYGGPTPDIPEEHTWYARNLKLNKDRAEAAEARLAEVVRGRDALIQTTEANFRQWKGATARAERLEAALREARTWVKASHDNVVGLSQSGAGFAKNMLARIDAAIASPKQGG